MKKQLLKQIEFTANMLPEAYEFQKVTSTLPGDVANLCVVGRSPYDPNKEYEFTDVVAMKINHVSRLKDGVKTFGMGFIRKYMHLVTQKNHD